MKKVLILTICFICLTACNSSPKKTTTPAKDPFLVAIEKVTSESLNDPSSYEFVKLERIDSTTYKDNIDYRIDQFTEWKQFAQGRNDKDVKYYTTLIKEIKDLEAQMGTKVNGVASYTYLYSFRSKNAFGALVLGEYIVQISPTYEIFGMTDNVEKILLNPGGFPGYMEILERNKR